MDRSREAMTVARSAGVTFLLATLLACGLTIRAHALAHTGAPGLDIPFGLRADAMGLAGVADRSDPDNIFFNPANVTAVDGVYSTNSYRLLLPTFQDKIWFGHVGAGAGYAFGAEKSTLVALNVTLAHLSYGEALVLYPSGFEKYKPTEGYFALTAGAATRIGERVEWALGVAYKHWSADYSSIVDESANMVDFGTVVSTVIDASDWRVRPALGLAAVNVGSDIEISGISDTDPLPSWFNYGFTVRVDAPTTTLGSNEVPTVSATLNFQGDHGRNDQRPLWGFGYELTLVDVLSVRWGRRIDDFERRPTQTWGVGLSLPVGPVRARVDYANTTNDYTYGSRDVFGVSLAWLFGGRE